MWPGNETSTALYCTSHNDKTVGMLGRTRGAQSTYAFLILTISAVNVPICTTIRVTTMAVSCSHTLETESLICECKECRYGGLGAQATDLYID